MGHCKRCLFSGFHQRHYDALGARIERLADLHSGILGNSDQDRCLSSAQPDRILDPPTVPKAVLGVQHKQIGAGCAGEVDHRG
jgi:hypothetical protein